MGLESSLLSLLGIFPTGNTLNISHTTKVGQNKTIVHINFIDKQ